MDPAISDTPPAPSHARTRFEVIFASIWIAFGLFGLPAAIYLVGVLMLGPYKPGAGLMQFYADFFGNLAEPALRAWVIAFGPLILVSALRLIFWGVPARKRSASSPPAAPIEPVARSVAKTRERVEPRIDSE